MLQQLKPDFGKILNRQISSPPSSDIPVTSFFVPLSGLSRHYQSLSEGQNPLLQEPHMAGFSPKGIKPSKALAKLHPAFNWWGSNDIVGAVAQGSPVSLNINDVSKNIQTHRYELRSFKHLSQSVREELFSYYMKYPEFEAKLLKNLDRYLRNTADNQKPSNVVNNLQMELQSV